MGATYSDDSQTTTNAGVNVAPTNIGTGTTASQQQSPVTAPSLMTMSSIMGFIPCISALSVGGKEYTNQIDNVLKAENKINYEIRPITTDKIDSRLIINLKTKHAIALIFEESNSSSIDTKTPGERSAEVVKRINNDKTIKIIQALVVTPEEYSLATNMAKYIINTFTMLENVMAITVDHFSTSTIHISTNLQEAREFIKSISPHAVDSRSDIGFVVKLEQQVEGENGMKQTILRPIIGVTAFTSFKIYDNPSMPGEKKFSPIVRVTEVQSIIPMRHVLALVEPLAAQMFIFKNLWQRPYRTYAKGMPTLASLIPNEKGVASYTIENDAAFDKFVATYLTEPYLAFDICEGRARIPGIDLMMTDAMSLHRIFNEFTNGALSKFPITSNANIVALPIPSLVGTVKIDGNTLDSRAVDYLSLATKISTVAQISKFLLPQAAQDQEFKYVQEHFPNAKALYPCTTVIITSTYVNALAGSLSAIKISDDLIAQNQLSLSQLGNGVNNFRGINQLGSVANASYYFGGNDYRV